MERFSEDLGLDGGPRSLRHSPDVYPWCCRSRLARPYRVIRERSLTAEAVVDNVDVIHVNGLSLKAIARALLAKHRPVVTHAGYQAICPMGLAWSTSSRCDVAEQTSGRCSVCPQGLHGRAKVRLHRAGAAAAAVNVSSRYLAERANVPRSVTIYNPVSDRVFKAELGGNLQDDMVVFAGRLVAEKGLDVLLRAVAMLPGVRLRVAGEPYEVGVATPGSRDRGRGPN